MNIKIVICKLTAEIVCIWSQPLDTTYYNVKTALPTEKTRYANYGIA